MTRRAVLIGLALAIFVAVWPAYSSLIVNSSRADFAHLSVAFLIPFVCLMAANLLLGRHRLSSSELLTIACIGMVAANMQGEWLSDYFVGTISAPYYFASPENRWHELLLPYVPSWTVVADRAAVVGFYEGLPDGASIPWQPWLVPFFWWGGFLCAVLLACFAVSVVMRRQWMDYERLPFPLAAALLELTGTSGSGQTFGKLVHNRLFRTGFGLTLGAIGWNIMRWFGVGIPRLPVLTTRVISIGKGFPQLRFAVHPMTLAFGYFVKSDVLLSIWFFHLLAMLQVGLMNRIGFTMSGSDPWCSFHPAIGWQSFGGLIVLVGWGLWVGREHLAAVLRKALWGDPSVDDSGELISYRGAFWLFVGCAAYMALWLRQAGMNWGPLLAFGFATLVLYFGLARIIVESGLVYLRGPITAQAFTWHLFGIAGMGPASAAVLGGLTYTFFCDAKTFGMTALAHIPRLGSAMERGRRRLVPLVLVGCLLGASAVIGLILYQGYHTMGSYNFGVPTYRGDNSSDSWQVAANRIREGTAGTSWLRMKFLGVGMAFTGLLFYLRTLFPTFPIHPVGFTISASLILQDSVSSIFMVWLAKTLILRLGGLERYRRMVPFFLGLMMGFLAGIGLGVIVDVIWFPGHGHELNRW